MKNLSSLVVICGAALLVASCTPDPKACFTFSRTDVKVGDTLTLLNCSSDFDEVQWSFPLGGTNKDISPRIKLGTPGQYPITLKVGTVGFTKSDMVTQSLDVKP